jgi:hypothetical protein
MLTVIKLEQLVKVDGSWPAIINNNNGLGLNPACSDTDDDEMANKTVLILIIKYAK